MTGLELLIDAWAEKNLASLEACSAFMDQVVQALGMTELERFRVELPTSLPTGPGISITVVIIESHLALHTWPEYGALLFNAVSCVAFNPELVRSLLEAAFDATVTQFQTIERRV